MVVKASYIADYLGFNLNGGNPLIYRCSSLNNFSAGSLVFVLNCDKETLDKLNEYDQILALVPENLASEIKCPHIIVDRPRLAFGKIVQHFFYEKKAPKISNTAVIGENVSLGKEITIGEYTVICDNASIGDRTEIRHHVVIGENTIIGDDCVVRSNSVIGEEGMGIASDNMEGPPELIPQIGNVVIGNKVETGTFTTINRGTLDSTIIKDNVKIGHHVNIGHNVIIEEDSILTSCCEVSGSSTIGRNVWIGINACVLEYIRIGDRAKVGMGAVVVKDVAPEKIVVGNPARILRDRREQ